MADSKNIDDGGRAFQVPSGTFGLNGMSLRDYFAGQALAGLYSCRELQLSTLADMAGKGAGGDFEDKMAKQAYLQADAMIAARKAGGRS